MQAVKKVNKHRSFVRDKIVSCYAVVLFAAYVMILLRTNAQPEERICWYMVSEKKKQSWRRMSMSYEET